VLAVIIWFLFLKSGIHPTIAGVLLAFTIPVNRRIDIPFFSENIKRISSKLLDFSDNDDENHLLTSDEVKCIENLDDLTTEVRSPLQHLEHRLHSLIAYFILPIFAFANAGVVISANYDFNFTLMTNIALSLFFGKLIGVSLFSYLGLKFKITELPSGVNFKQIIGVSAIAGVGFTMSIFIDNLAFEGDLISINSVKVGIIIGSLVAGIIGYLILRFTSSNESEKE
ncbi:MAG: Na+/H+ antiporter NhaA, partial [Flavobacteriaceae bacterium]|nr:Na+/H+ antiporter NhaA [Flavobacteriaceae bacterium]